MVAKRIKSKPKKSAQKKPAMKQRRTAPKLGSALDAAGLAHARMLADPCNALMAPPCYAGMGTGEYRRFRRIINVPLAVEGTYAFVPGGNVFYAATHIAANAGLPYTFNQFKLFESTQLEGNTESRCIAACVKIRFTGAEAERKGVIGLRTSPFSYTVNAQTSTNDVQLTGCPLLNRVGEVQHEVKFVPGTGDELFTGNFGDAVIPANALGAFGFTFSDVPTLSLQLEVTAIIEVEPRTAQVVNSVSPSSRNTTNNILSALGPPAKWAYGHVVAPTIRSFAGAAMQTISSGLNSRSVGGMLLTL